MADPQSINRSTSRKRMIVLTTDDTWDADAHHTSPACPSVETTDRRSREYIGSFRERIPALRAIRLKCGACMGGDADRMPRGEVAQAIDECGSSLCPLWPFRYGRDPWREPVQLTEEQRSQMAQRLARVRS